mgnify:CR=1 FL=1
MAQKNRDILKDFFRTGQIPTQNNYVDLIDSFSTIGADSNSGSMVLTGSLDITGSVNITGPLETSQNVSLTSGDLSVTGTVTSNGATISGSLLSNNLSISTGSGANDKIKVLYAGNDIHFSVADRIYFGTDPSNHDTDRELYIQTDKTVFDTGSVHFNGNVEYGLNINQTHEFRGHITASHNISSSGTITAEHILSSDDIVAQGDISSSGTVFADNFTSTGGDVGGISFTDGVNITGSITASSEISSSDTIRGNLFIAPASTIGSNISTTGNVSGNSGTGSFAQLESTKFIGSRPIVTKTSNTTLALEDAGTYNRCGSHIITIPLNSSVAFDIGTEIEFIQTSSAGHLFFNSGSTSVTLNSRHSIYSASGQFSAVSCKKVATNEWDIIGDLTA